MILKLLLQLLLNSFTRQHEWRSRTQQWKPLRGSWYLITNTRCQTTQPAVGMDWLKLFTCVCLLLKCWFQSAMPRPPNVCMLLWYSVWRKQKRSPMTPYSKILRPNPQGIITAIYSEFNQRADHLCWPTCRLQALCSSRPPALPGCPALGRGTAARCLGCPGLPAAHSGPGSCCHKGTTRRWTPCWSRWRNDAHSMWRAPLAAAARDSWGGNILMNQEEHKEAKITGDGVTGDWLGCFSPQKVVHHIWISVQQTHQNLILQIRRHLQQQEQQSQNSPHVCNVPSLPRAVY